MYREIFGLEKQLPSTHLDSLQKYLQTSSRLNPRGEEHNRPVIRHPDLRPRNIFVSDDFESLPDNSSALDEDNRQAQLELFHKRKLHHFYMTETSRHNLTH
jgi:hypothetical protein